MEVLRNQLPEIAGSASTLAPESGLQATLTLEVDEASLGVTAVTTRCKRQPEEVCLDTRDCQEYIYYCARDPK